MNASSQALAELVKPWKVSGSYRPFKPVGCVDCRMTGFRGRMGFFEVIRISSALRTAIAENRPVIELRRILGPDFVTMRADGIQKAALGLTTVEEVLRATQDVDDATD